MTSVSAGHIILTPTQSVGNPRLERGSNPRPRSQKSRALPTELPARPLSLTRVKSVDLQNTSLDDSEYQAVIRQNRSVEDALLVYLSNATSVSECSRVMRACRDFSYDFYRIQSLAVDSFGRCVRCNVRLSEISSYLRSSNHSRKKHGYKTVP